MKVAVTASGTDLDSEVDPRFGRARYFLVVEADSKDVQVLDNSPGVNAAGGAGVQAAQRIAQAGAKVLITGHCGPNAHRVLTQAGIKVYLGASGTVRDAIEQFQRGDLQDGSVPDVPGHW